MHRFTVGLLSLGALFLALSFSLGIFAPSFWSGFWTSHAQSSEDSRVWVFDGHMHPISSVYRRGGTIGEPNADPRFTLSLAKMGGLGAALFNTSIDEFYEVNHLAVKDALRQIDRFYREIAQVSRSSGSGHQCPGGQSTSPRGQNCRYPGH